MLRSLPGARAPRPRGALPASGGRGL